MKAYCQQPKSSICKKPESTLVVGKSGAYLIRGFSNFARNCFFNAVVQVLLCIAPLRVPFMKLNQYDRRLTRAVKDLFIKTSLPSVSDCNTAFGNLYVCFCAKAPPPISVMVGIKTPTNSCFAYFNYCKRKKQSRLGTFLIHLLSW